MGPNSVNRKPRQQKLPSLKPSEMRRQGAADEEEAEAEADTSGDASASSPADGAMTDEVDELDDVESDLPESELVLESELDFSSSVTSTGTGCFAGILDGLAAGLALGCLGLGGFLSTGCSSQSKLNSLALGLLG